MNYNCVIVTVITIMDKITTNKLPSTQLLEQPHIFNLCKLHQTSVVSLLPRAKYTYPRTKILNHSIKSQLLCLPFYVCANDSVKRGNRFASPPGLWEMYQPGQTSLPCFDYDGYMSVIVKCLELLRWQNKRVCIRFFSCLVPQEKMSSYCNCTVSAHLRDLILVF